MILFAALAVAALSSLDLAAAQDGSAVLSAAVAANHSLFWNTYRPQLYHGIRPRTPQSLMTGLMWFGLNDYQGVNQIRHTCEQADEITRYTYTAHDGRYYAQEVVEDGKLNVRLDISWLKEPSGREWAVRVEGDAMDASKPSRTAVLYHFGLEGLGELVLDDEEEQDGITGEVTLSGTSPQLGRFRLRIVDHPGSKPIPLGPYASDFAHTAGKTAFFGLRIPTGDVWKIKDYVARILHGNAQQLMESGPYTPEAPPDPAVLFRLSNEVYAGGANVYALQKNVAGSGRAQGGKWGFDVLFETVEDRDDGGMTYDELSNALETAQAAYAARFKQTFPLPAPYDTPAHYAFAQDVTSNLVGGIGYYHGASIVDRSFRHEYDGDDEDDEDDDGSGQEKPRLTEERELLTATPSRSFFPRGFYWDEGFHLALIGEWDNDLSLEILKDWVALIDEDGWVAREQILGDESRSKVPAEFQTQYPLYANPPTLTMAVTSFIRRLRARHSDLDAQLGMDPASLFPSFDLATAHLDHPVLAHAYLGSIYPALRRHYLWFRRTQRGLLKPFDRRPRSREAYRWRGRTENHVLTSGLDDYPRARPPHVGELHVDLLSWVGFFARTMGEISEFLGLDDDREEYARHERGVVENLDDLHWSDEHKMYCDVSVDADDESVHVCHAGYISLFPFMLGLLPADHPNLAHVLDLMESPKHLWSSYGLRSLSASHPLFGKDENYWRGPVWVQMNWLVLKAIKERYSVAGEHATRARSLYDRLRANIVENVFQEYERTGYVWEQYDAHTGEGRRSHPFTGWTSLVTMIMTEKYS